MSSISDTDYISAQAKNIAIRGHARPLVAPVATCGRGRFAVQAKITATLSREAPACTLSMVSLMVCWEKSNEMWEDEDILFGQEFDLKMTDGNCC